MWRPEGQAIHCSSSFLHFASFCLFGLVLSDRVSLLRLGLMEEYWYD